MYAPTGSGVKGRRKGDDAKEAYLLPRRAAAGIDALLTPERKRSATTAETFGSTLTSLLSESSKKPKKSAKGAAPVADVEGEDGDVAKNKLAGKAAGQPQNNILSLSHIKAPPSRAAENLERKAKRHIQALKMEKEDKARVRDVVEGWAARHVEGGPEVLGGQEFEKGLRKTAQRGGEFINSNLATDCH